MLDCGAIVQEWRPEIAFVTHTHSDHANRVTHIVSRHKPPTIYAPASAVPLMEGYIDAHQAMTDNRPLEALMEAMERGEPEWKINRIIKPASPGDTIQVQKGGKDWEIQVVACDHSVDCVGYAFREKKKALKAEYQGMAGRELGQLRKQGVEIQEETFIPRFLFMGDTTPKVYQDQPELLKFPVVITECSFILDEHRESARRTKHTHWIDLEPYVTAHPETLFVLIHFSMRYTGADISAFFMQLDLPNVVPFLDTETVKRGKWVD